MTFNKYIWVLLFVFCFNLKGKAQNNTYTGNLIEDLIELIAEENDSDYDYSQITDDLNYYLNNKLNLNTATTDNLEKLHLLSPFQILSLQNYISSHGKMLTIYELQLVEGFDITTIKKMLPFVKIADETTESSWKLQNAMKYGNQKLMGRVSIITEQQEGFIKVSDSARIEHPNSYYNGNKLKILTKYKFNYKNKLQFGFIGEKDPGEQFFSGEHQHGFDYNSAYFQINDIGIVKTAVFGDFQAQFGQGLIMWSYLRSAKSGQVINIKKHGNSLNRYNSSDENNFLRGGGFTLKKYGLKFSVFASHKAVDANVKTDTITNKLYFTSFQNTGIHATAGELNNKHAVNQTIFGVNANWQKNKLRIGVSAIKYHFNIPLQIEKKPENTFKFYGTKNSNLSTDIEYRFNKMHFFGEAALSENGGNAYILGAIMELNSQFRTSVLHRNYAKNYQALYSNAFGENSHTQNEKGTYIGAEILPYKKWKLSCYYDMFSFPWLTFNANSPTKGNDYFIQADYTVSGNLQMYWRYKNEIKQQNNGEQQTAMGSLNSITKSYLRYQLAFTPLNSLTFRNRLELSQYQTNQKNTENGYMLYQDIIYRPKHSLSLIFRYAVFDTKSYNTRIYTYENDVLYAFSVPALYGKGTRTYITLRYNMAKNVDVWLRLSQTWYAHKTEIGTGPMQINNNTKSEIKIQVMWKF